MTQWGWTPKRDLGIWRYCAGWMRPHLVAMPYLTVLLLLMMFFFIGGTLTSAKGLLFDLPDGRFSDADDIGLVVLVMPMQRDTMVFFDGSRYLLDDRASMRKFADALSESAERSAKKTLLVLADRRVSAGNMMELMSLMKRNRFERVLFAGKSSGGDE